MMPLRTPNRAAGLFPPSRAQASVRAVQSLLEHATRRAPLLGRLRRRDDGGPRTPELRDYIGRELDRGRNLFDVLGDPHVWAQFEEDPILLSRVAQAAAIASPGPPAPPSTVLKNGDGGVAP
jgi:hypothetical protein